jgi:hypothetical protein
MLNVLSIILWMCWIHYRNDDYNILDVEQVVTLVGT